MTIVAENVIVTRGHTSPIRKKSFIKKCYIYKKKRVCMMLLRNVLSDVVVNIYRYESHARYKTVYLKSIEM